MNHDIRYIDYNFSFCHLGVSDNTKFVNFKNETR